MARKAARRVRRTSKRLVLAKQRQALAYEHLKRCEAAVRRLEKDSGEKD